MPMSTHRPDDPGRVRIDSDMLAGQLHGVAGRQAAHGVFRGRVVREQREGFEGDDRGGREQFAGIVLRAGALLDELLGRSRVAVVHAEDVDAEHALEVGRGEVEEGFYLGDAGVGDPIGRELDLLGSVFSSMWAVIREKGGHCVQRAEFVHALLDYAFYFAHYGDVAYCHGRFPA